MYRRYISLCSKLFYLCLSYCAFFIHTIFMIVLLFINYCIIIYLLLYYLSVCFTLVPTPLQPEGWKQ